MVHAAQYFEVVNEIIETLKTRSPSVYFSAGVQPTLCHATGAERDVSIGLDPEGIHGTKLHADSGQKNESLLS